MIFLHSGNLSIFLLVSCAVSDKKRASCIPRLEHSSALSDATPSPNKQKRGQGYGIWKEVCHNIPKITSELGYDRARAGCEVLKMKWAAQAPDQNAAWELYVELL